ncbi:MAG: thrombospondin type 3 repeat-containing protein [Deltaproteobacteria bacterium]|nr:thrombospondin type 3 repeat-containing protein [Deltaproteobacteria bacterium]
MSIRRCLVLTAAFALVSGLACSGGEGDVSGDGNLQEDTAGEAITIDVIDDTLDPGPVDPGGTDPIPADEITGDEGATDPGPPDPGPETDGTPPCVAEPGCPCTDNEDCFSGICVETMEEWVCSSYCIDDQSCPDGWKCLVVGGSGADVFFGCVDPFARLCQPCVNDAECVPAVASSGKYACVPHGPQGSFCGVECANDEGCPAGFICTDVEVDRGMAKQCIPEGEATCPCTQKYQDQGNLTECFMENEHGVCFAQRTCDIECDAPDPAPEACNGQDEDCDGITDEEIPFENCPLENTYGTCQGIKVCTGGLEKCEGTFPAPEICNGLDENCDGQEDEVFPDMDGDGEADCVDTDIDGDTVLNPDDNCPEVPNGDQTNCDGDDEGAACDADDDNDWVPDVSDNCLCLANPDQENLDGDGSGDACDCDIDDDGVGNTNLDCPPPEPEDNCPYEPNAGQVDLDEDGLGDACDADRDGDGVQDQWDNCPDHPNKDQADHEKDLLGDVCDPDDDNDIVYDDVDNCPFTYNPDQADIDDDKLGDACDDDNDGDGVLNGEDNCPSTPNPGQEDLNQNDVGDACEADWDGDGVPNTQDNCPWVANSGQEDLDEDEEGDACDCDRDGDGANNENPGCEPPDPADNCPDVANPGQDNLDGDSQGDLCDPDRDGDGDPNESDCAPDHPAIFNGQNETCNEFDDDCDGDTDEDGATGCLIYFYDEDGDQYGVEDNRCLCATDGFYTATEKGDCLDTDGEVNPGAEEICNGKDDDCSGGTDEEGTSGCTVYFRDFDLDDFGLTADSQCLCENDPPYVALVGGDCDDFDQNIWPGAAETCSLKDDDCDGDTDEEDALGCEVYFFDFDQDTYGDSDDSKCLCEALGKYSADVGYDCDDENQVIFPGSVEVCPNGLDDDCDDLTDEAGCQGCTDYHLDVDDDTYGMDDDKLCLSDPEGDYKATQGGDCNDSDGDVHPDAAEVCNGKDDDCDAATDEKDAGGCEDYFLDFDGDTFGVDGNTKCLCGASGTYTAYIGGDCRDTDSTVFPGATESCNNKDDDCNSETDEKGAVGCDIYYFDGDSDGFGVSWNFKCLCGPEGQYDTKVAGDCDDDDAFVHPDATESCNGKDDDCNDFTDEEDAVFCLTWFFDDDGDTFGVAGLTRCLCAAEGKHTADKGGDCNDFDATVNPDAVEVCNGKDDDCEGTPDNEDAGGCDTYYLDNDSDDYGIEGDSKCLCGAFGKYTASLSGDCDDEAPEVHPTAEEFCANEVDDDCDNETDEAGCSGCITYYLDVDGDTWGVEGDSQCMSEATGNYRATKTGDCKDDNPEINPGATEVCNSADDDCNQQIDEEGAGGCTEYFKDADMDTWGITGDSRCLCATEASYTTTTSGDCDDGNGNIHPGGQEICNDLDDDCDWIVDEEGATGCGNLRYDYDQDGFGVEDIKCLCESKGKYTAAGGGDCDDSNNQIFPGATEACNNLDDDCDQQTDEEGATGCIVFYNDTDADGYGSSLWKCLCGAAGDFKVLNDDDCCDTSSPTHPGQTGYFTQINACNSYDYNCSGQEDKQWTTSGGGCSDWGVGNGCNVESGWEGGTASCGQSKTYITGGCGYCCFLWTCCCEPSGSSRTQGCR